jgi:hypothetical protein
LTGCGKDKDGWSGVIFLLIPKQYGNSGWPTSQASLHVSLGLGAQAAIFMLLL